MMNRSTGKRTNEGANKQTNGWKYEQTDGQTKNKPSNSDNIPYINTTIELYYNYRITQKYIIINMKYLFVNFGQLV